MRLRFYSVFDRLMGIYIAPFVARADVEACRQLKASLEDPQMAKSAIVQSPRDYTLYYVGTFNDETGEVSVEEQASGPAPALVVSVERLLGKVDV